MGLLDQIMGQPEMDRFARQRADFSRTDTDDFNKWNELVGAAPPEQVEEAYARAARDVDEREYYEHVTPGVGGTNPMGDLPPQARTGLASKLLGILGGGGAMPQNIPGVRNTDPNRMSEQELAQLADYLRRNHPEQFGRVAAQVQREEPGLLQSLMGNKMLLLAAAGLAGKLLTDRRR